MIAAAVLAVAALALQSKDFGEDGTLPRAIMSADCGGANRTPELHWSGVPATTRSFALIVVDPDAPLAGGFYHWIVYDIPGSTLSLEAATPLEGSRTGMASSGKAAYYGPCPPPGPAHHYVFTLYALDVGHVAANTPLSASELQRRIGGHVVGKATLTGFASH